MGMIKFDPVQKPMSREGSPDVKAVRIQVSTSKAAKITKSDISQAIMLVVIFAALDVSLAVKVCINCSLLHLFLLYYFTNNFPRRPQSVDLYEIWYSGSFR